MTTVKTAWKRNESEHLRF